MTLVEERVPSLKLSIAARLDRSFAVTLLASFIAHFGMALYLTSIDWPRSPELDEVPERWVRAVARPLPLPSVAKHPAVEATTGPSAEPAGRARPTIRRRLGDGQELQRLRRRALALVTARLEGSEAVADLLSPRIDRDQEEAFRGVAGITVATERPLTSLDTGAATGRAAAPQGLRAQVAIARADVLPSLGERRVQVRQLPPRLDEPVVGVDLQHLARLIRRHMLDVRGCYERALKRRPELQGKIVLRIAIAPAGTVREVSIEDDTVADPEVAACLRALARRWRFPASAGAEMTVPFIFQPGE